MTTTEERLAEIEARAKAARSFVLLCDDDAVKAREHKTSLYRWHFDGTWHDANQLSNAPDDIKFLLDLVRRQAAALAAVEGLHKPGEVMAWWEDCTAPDDHSTMDDPHGGGLLCTDEVLGRYCVECAPEAATDMTDHPWPCPTVRAIREAMEGEGDE